MAPPAPLLDAGDHASPVFEKLHASRNGVFEPSCSRCTNGNEVTVVFEHDTFVFHSQWLHDARCDNGASKNAKTAICTQPEPLVRVDTVRVCGTGASAVLEVVWQNGDASKLPLTWLQVMGPLVANRVGGTEGGPVLSKDGGWTVSSLEIPEISYHSLFSEETDHGEIDRTILSVIDLILAPSSPGIVKIVDLPDPNFEDEHNHVRNINTQVLKRLFGAVFIHPIRGPDQTFNVSSHSHDATRKIGIPNYDTTQVLLPHTDHAFYDMTNQVQGFYGLEGTSENTFVSVLACLETLKYESPESYRYLTQTPMTVGRISRFYGDAVLNSTVDTPVTTQPGFPDQFKRMRWHPNLTGSLLAPYDDYKAARQAHRTLHEIMRRDTHQLKTILKPGDLYILDNFRLLHGRESVLETPRTGVGQTVPESVAHDRYRALANRQLRHIISDDWLVHVPMVQLRQMVGIVESDKRPDRGNANHV